jgi:3-dehydroquinate synthase
MIAAAELAQVMGLFDAASVARLRALVARAGLPCRVPSGLSARQILETMKADKKVVAGRQRYVLPREIGQVEVRDDVDATLAERVLREMGAGG